MLDNKFNSILIQPFSELNNKYSVNDLIYHYTSPSAFISIFKSGKIRFTDIRFLNDNSGKLYFIKKLLEFCEKNRNQYPAFVEAVNSLLKENDLSELKNLKVSNVKYYEDTILPYKPDRTFVFCASKDCDSLNMWNYYIRNGDYQGYSIGLKIDRLLSTFDTSEPNQADSFIVLYGEILYDEKKQFDEIEKLAQKIEHGAKRADRLSMDGAILKVRAYIDLQGAFYKSPKFKY